MQNAKCRMQNAECGRRIARQRVRVGVFLVAAALNACQMADQGKEAAPASYGLGTAATPAEVARLNSDVSPSGEGLPPGHGDATRGEALYQAQCASCHGAKGEGVPGNPPGPQLVGREPREGFGF